MSGISDEFLRQQARWRDLLESPMEKFIREQEKLRELTEPTALRIARESARREEMIDLPLGTLLNDTRLDLSRFACALDVPAFRAASEANLALLRMNEPDYISRYSQSLAMDQAWRVDRLSIPDLGPLIADHVSRMSEFSALAELRLGQVDWDRLGARWNFEAPEIAMLRDRSTEMAITYAGLFEHLGDRLTEFPPAVSAEPPIELLRAADLLVISSSGDAARSEVDEISSASVSSIRGLLDESLATYDVGLLKMLRGARSALGTGNPDRTRHVSASLRELATQVLHRLAPDDKVKAWSMKADHFDKGRPTRRGRLEYIARQVDSDPFSEFLEADYKAAVKFFDVLHGGTHRPSIELTDEQLWVLIARAEALIYFLLKLPN